MSRKPPVALGGHGLIALRRSCISPSDRSTLSLGRDVDLDGVPPDTAAMGPRAASGQTCPIQAPVAPEYRTPVTIATVSPSPSANQQRRRDGQLVHTGRRAPRGG